MFSEHKRKGWIRTGGILNDASWWVSFYSNRIGEEIKFLRERATNWVKKENCLCGYYQEFISSRLLNIHINKHSCDIYIKSPE